MRESEGGAGRLFLAVGLTDEVRTGLEARLREAAGARGLPGRPVRAANWHLTLRFLGDTGQEAAERMRAELRRADLGPGFRIGFGGLGAFPKPRRAGVLWVGVDEGAAELSALAAAVEGATTRAGFTPEGRAFRAHLTVSRMQPATDVTALVDAAKPAGLAMAVGAVTLYRSHLGSGPPRYEAVERFALGGGGGVVT